MHVLLWTGRRQDAFGCQARTPASKVRLQLILSPCNKAVAFHAETLMGSRYKSPISEPVRFLIDGPVKSSCRHFRSLSEKPA